MAPRYTTKVLRDALFALPSARGNIPHLTYEDAEHEGRRLNAPRYETIGEMDAALDRRVREINAPSQLNGATAPPSPGQIQQPPAQGGSLVGSLLLILLGAGVAYLMLKKDDGDGEKDVTPSPLVQNPPNPAQPVVTVVMPNLPVQPAQLAPAPAPIVVPAQVSPLLENPTPKRRRRSKVVTTTNTATNTVVATESKQT